MPSESACAQSLPRVAPGSVFVHGGTDIPYGSMLRAQRKHIACPASPVVATRGYDSVAGKVDTLWQRC